MKKLQYGRKAMKKSVNKFLAVLISMTMIFSQMAILSSAVAKTVVSVTAVAQRKLIENYDGNYLDWDYFGEDIGYFSYNISNCNPEYTITYQDGTIHTGNEDEIYEQTGYRPYVYAIQSYENQLGIGNHTGYVSFLNVEGTFEFEIVENPVESITAVATSTLIENCDGWMSNNGDEYKEYFYYDLDQCYPEYTVTYKDGTVYTGQDYEIAAETGYWPYVYADQFYENQLGVGNHTGYVTFLKVEGTFEFEIVENPVESVTAVATSTLIENYDGRMSNYGNEYKEYFRYDLDHCYPEYTVTYKDGTVYTGQDYEIAAETGYRPYVYADQSYENQLGVGKYTGYVSLLGVESTFEFEIIENPISRVTVVATKTLLENCDGWMSGDWDEYDEYKEYYFYNIGACNLQYTVTYKDGRIYMGQDYEIEEETGYYPYVDVDQSYENQLGVGKHTGYVYLLGTESTFEFEIVENPVESVTAVGTRALIENYGGYWDYDYSDSGERVDYFYYDVDFYSNPIYTVTYKDGTVYTGYDIEIYELTGYFPHVYADQSYENQLGVGKHTGYAHFRGVESTFEFEIIENPVESVTAVGTMALIENYGGYWDYDYSDSGERGDYFYYHIIYCEPEYTVTYKDGTVYTGSAEEIYSKIGHYPSVYADQSYENSLGVGKHTGYVSFLDVEGTLEFEIIETPVASVTAVATKTLIENYSGWYAGRWNDDIEDYVTYFYYDVDFYGELIYTITYKDGTVYTGYSDEIGAQTGHWPYAYTISYDNQLSVGKNTGYASFLTVESTFEFEIVETPVASVTAVATKVLIENYSGGDSLDWDAFEKFFYYYIKDCEPEYTVTYKDGTVYTGNDEEIYEQTGYWPSVYAEQSYENQLGVGKHTGYVYFLGVENTFEFEIVELNQRGDVNFDGIVDSNDYAMVRSYVMFKQRLSKKQLIAADFNRDGVVDAFDAIAIDVYINTGL